jgi:DNA-binding response OmpR family regulator
MTIMIIDDDAEDAMLLYEVIKEIAPQVKCTVSYSYISAKSSLDDGGAAPDFIFLNALLYPIGGKETLMRLTQMEILHDTKIVVNSGVLSQAQKDEFSLLGADCILQKPGNYDSLLASVKEILSTK